MPLAPGSVGFASGTNPMSAAIMFQANWNSAGPVVSKFASKLPRPDGTGNEWRNSMFNNLIESSSHAKEFKRRGSFLLFTTATYLMLFAVTGVVSIYAYDAHLEARSTELELLTFVPVPPPDTPAELPRNTIRP